MLELYAAGALDASERKEVERMLAEHKELRDELDAIEQALENYAVAHARKPRKEVFDTIVSSIKGAEQTEQQTSAKTVAINATKPRSSNVLRYMAIAATLLLFVSVAINFYYYSNFHRVQDELAELRDQNTFLTDRNEVIQADFQALKTEIDVIKSPSYVAVTMKGMDVSPNSIASVYWDKTTGRVYVNANNLPAPEAGKQYQLWALKDGKPIDAGVFTMSGELQLMKNISEADAFAITLEPTGGVPVPTGSIYVVGNV